MNKIGDSSAKEYQLKSERVDTISAQNWLIRGDSSVDFSIQVDINQSQREKHLRSDDFFDVDAFAMINFKSTAVTYSETGDPVTTTGSLELHGVAKSVTFAVTAIGSGVGPRKQQRAGYAADLTIKRSYFGMNEFGSFSFLVPNCGKLDEDKKFLVTYVILRQSRRIFCKLFRGLRIETRASLQEPE